MERDDSIRGHGHENDVLEPLIAKEEAVVFRDHEQNEWKCNKALVWEEVKKQCCIARPMLLVNLLQYSLRMISIMLVGHVGELALSSASIATSFADVSGFTLLVE
ncbi:hypothetical protein SUGI_0142890 [Cryptomeria japonica]|nr:hypothetical protein SUGI_0142890 [Cryptomeria japonica]